MIRSNHFKSGIDALPVLGHLGPVNPCQALKSLKVKLRIVFFLCDFYLFQARLRLVAVFRSSSNLLFSHFFTRFMSVCAILLRNWFLDVKSFYVIFIENIAPEQQFACKQAVHRLCPGEMRGRMYSPHLDFTQDYSRARRGWHVQWNFDASCSMKQLTLETGGIEPPKAIVL